MSEDRRVGEEGPSRGLVSAMEIRAMGVGVWAAEDLAPGASGHR